MNKNLNRRNIFLLSRKKFLYISIILLIILSILFIYNKKNFFIKNTKIAIENFSQNYQYQYLNLKVEGLDKVEKSYLEKKLQKYYGSSIFLLPLETISKEIKENNWIKNIKLTTNYKDTISVNLEEYKPLGIYSFNNKLFYFDENGKIIEEINKSISYDNNLIIFFGSSSNLNAKYILNLLQDVNFADLFEINRIGYVKKRRWDIILNNNKKLMLSENEPKKSIENFIKIVNSLSRNDFNNIKYFDLRNTKKSLIAYY